MNIQTEIKIKLQMNHFQLSQKWIQNSKNHFNIVSQAF